MNYLKLFVSILLLAFTISCNNTPKSVSNQEETNVTINGSITEPTSNYVIALSLDGSDTVQIDDNNQFSFHLKLANPQYVTIVNGPNSLQVFAEPQKTLEVNFSNNKISESVEFKGENANENLYLKKKLQLLLIHSMPLEHVFDRPVKEFRHLVDSLYVVEKILLDEHIQEHPDLSVAFTKMEYAALLYDRATKLMEYPRLSSFGKEINEEKYFKFLNKLDVNDESLWPVFEFREFLNAYVEYYAYKKIFTDEVREVYAYEATLARMQQIVAKFTNQTIKNRMLTKVLSTQVKYHGYKNTELLFQMYELQCTDEALKEKMLEPYQKYQEMQKGQPAANATFEDVDGNKFDLSHFAGQYVYVDVWATWCIPCRKEAPYFQQLSEDFSNKNMVFVKFSVDQKKEDWLADPHLKEHAKNQYWVTDMNTFLENYLIKTIPHFLVIDPEGNLIDPNAPRPSSKNTDWLNKLPEKPKN